jgi:hypothetical protein
LQGRNSPQQSGCHKRPWIVAYRHKLQYNQKGFWYLPDRADTGCGPLTNQNDFFPEDKLMNKLIAALIAGAFALGSVAAMAQVPQGDQTPAQPVDQAKLKADRAKAKADAAKLTPEEKAAAKKAKRASRQKELSTSVKSQQEGGASPQAQAAEAAKATADSKAQPKALPDKAAKQKALTETEKKAGPSQ